MNLMSHCQNRALLVWMMVWLCCYGYVFCYLVVSVGLSLEAHVSQVHNLLQCLCLCTSVCVCGGGGGGGETCTQLSTNLSLSTDPYRLSLPRGEG